MKRRFVLFLLFLAVGVAVTMLWRDFLRPSAQGGGLKNLSGRPGLVVRTPKGEKLDLADVQGKVALVHFWATWCQPCVEEMPGLARFWNRYEDRGDVVLYAISVDKEGWQKVDGFLQANGVAALSPRIYLDPGGTVAERFGTTMFPETYFVDRSGKVVEKVADAVDWSDPRVAAFVDSLVSPGG